MNLNPLLTRTYRLQPSFIGNIPPHSTSSMYLDPIFLNWIHLIISCVHPQLCVHPRTLSLLCATTSLQLLQLPLPLRALPYLRHLWLRSSPPPPRENTSLPQPLPPPPFLVLIHNRPRAKPSHHPFIAAATILAELVVASDSSSSLGLHPVHRSYPFLHTLFQIEV